MLNINDTALPLQSTVIQLCWTATELLVKYVCNDSQPYNPYTKCNDPLYQYDVVELFITPEGTVAPLAPPQHYIEVEISPSNALFIAKILNPNNTCRGIVDSELNCDSGYASWQAKMLNGGWYGYLALQWDIVDSITVAADEEKTVKIAKPKQSVYRGNFFRIDTPKGGVKEYDCWSPTCTEPACFHIPSLFGWIHLDGY